ncbi:hypothetical protein ACFYPA_06485 [Streptomyces sp. NPDC005775]|uniref:hypothetical protein n=1 Tax=Streptomyces sp. NPDC005775 TaxID=3364729 RepID=UPI00368BABBF
MKPIRIGRWHIEIFQRALHATRVPKTNPACTYCNGTGGHGYITDGGDGDWEDCQCHGLIAWRIPLWPRTSRQRAERIPF